MPDLPSHMKNDNWDFFVEAKSADPTHYLTGCKNLTENLLASVKIVGIDDYDKSLDKCRVWVGRAFYHYYVESDVAGAQVWVNAITEELTRIIYEPQARFASVKPNAFKYVPTEVKR